MKRLIISVITVFFLSTLFTFSIHAQDIPDAYRPLIEQYISDLSQPEKFRADNLGEFGGGDFFFDGNLNRLGYCLYDLNSDGSPELFMGNLDTSGYAAIYTLENGSPKALVLQRGTDTETLVLGNVLGHPEYANCIVTNTSWENNEPVYTALKLNGTGLTPVATFVGYSANIPKERLQLSFTPFSQYKSRPVNPPTEGPAGSIYRVYNSSTGEHLYTPDFSEAVILCNSGWINENIGWRAPTSGHAVYRLFNPVISDHLYTTDENEVSVLTSQHGWQADNNGQPLFYSGGDIAIYRLYSPSSGRHHLTKDENEYSVLPGHCWQQEGIKLNCIS